MGIYKIAAICLNGHCISSSMSGAAAPQSFCEDCGSAVISVCSECAVPIRGKYVSDHVLDLTKFTVPAYCLSCGKPYPWTISAIKTAIALIEEDESIVATERERLIGALPDIMTETPKTNLAVARLKKALSSAGKFTADGLRQFVIDFGCELVKKQLGL